MSPDDFIAAIGPAARALVPTTRIPASFTTAQAALESGWMKSQLAQKYHNLFGVKASKGWTGKTVDLPTTEYVDGKPVTVNATWRAYDSWQDSLLDHAQFLFTNPRYSGAFAYTSGTTFAMAVQACGYATDPQYSQKIISIIKTHNLSALDA
jgi:flagellar protein FlgJ